MGFTLCYEVGGFVVGRTSQNRNLKEQMTVSAIRLICVVVNNWPKEINQMKIYLASVIILFKDPIIYNL